MRNLRINLGKWLYPLEGLEPSRSIPVQGELVCVEPSPLSDEAKLPCR